MEIEAWFLAETTHYQKIDPVITLATVKANFGFDPKTTTWNNVPPLQTTLTTATRSVEKNT